MSTQTSVSSDRAQGAVPVAADVEKALRRAFSLGQTYWQQADSESYKQNAKADETREKFQTLVSETLAALEDDLLIAADLLAAAQCAANVLNLLEKENASLGFRARHVPFLLRAAIAKATGLASVDSTDRRGA